MPPEPNADLGDAELEVLAALWELGPSTVRQVLDHLHGRGRKLAYTTVLTVLTRLEQKRFVASDRSAQAYVYRPMVSRDKVGRSRLRAIMQTIYGGAAGPLVLQLMEDAALSAEEIETLRTMIDRHDAEGAPVSRRTRRQ